MGVALVRGQDSLSSGFMGGTPALRCAARVAISRAAVSSGAQSRNGPPARSSDQPRAVCSCLTPKVRRLHP